MATIFGFTLKGLKTFQGRDFLGIQGNIYYNGKKVGWYNDSGNGAMADIEFDGDREQCEKMERLLDGAVQAYYKRFPMKGEYASLTPDSEMFMSQLAELIDVEKTYKKKLKEGYSHLVYYTDAKTGKEYMGWAKTGIAFNDLYNQDNITDIRMYKDLSDFVIDENTPIPEQDQTEEQDQKFTQ